ncbi:MAG: hypothetical protein PHV70_13525, partial [Desulfobacteraceae bacterium]|nr:hypothetical protein [Desulfobacteraceae bacterium]
MVKIETIPSVNFSGFNITRASASVHGGPFVFSIAAGQRRVRFGQAGDDGFGIFRMVFRRLVPMNMDFPGSGPGQATVKPGMTAMGANRGSCRALSGFLQQLVTPSFRSE